jgi:hypothetical protein
MTGKKTDTKAHPLSRLSQLSLAWRLGLIFMVVSALTAFGRRCSHDQPSGPLNRATAGPTP